MKKELSNQVRELYTESALAIRESEKKPVINGVAIVTNKRTVLWEGDTYREVEIVEPSCIDKAFIDQMNMSESSKQYVAMIISIGHILHLKVISEGVESPDQVEVLKKIGCDYIQGFVWGKPMPPEEAGRLVSSIKK